VFIPESVPNASGAALTPRQLRERSFYDEFVKRAEPTIGSLKAVRGQERRPWNPYWHLAELVRNHFTGPDQRLLDFGCGSGRYGVQFAHIGYQVFGFDISVANVEAATQLAARYHMSHRTHFGVGTAEQLDYPDEFFDVVVGVDILHHVDIALAIGECLRVLRAPGIAIFKEPIEVPIFDRLRNSALGVWLRPKTSSFETHVTEDERKLNRGDMAVIRSVGGSVSEERFRLLTRLEALGIRPRTRRGASLLEIVDHWLLRQAPVLRPFGGNVVITFRKAD
jgi:SAM-dependent methyltransferase